MVRVECWIDEETAALLPDYARIKGHGSASGCIRFAVAQLMTRSPLTASQEAKLKDGERPGK